MTLISQVPSQESFVIFLR